jgi:hypothetical protein
MVHPLPGTIRWFQPVPVDAPVHDAAATAIPSIRTVLPGLPTHKKCRLQFNRALAESDSTERPFYTIECWRSIVT